MQNKTFVPKGAYNEKGMRFDEAMLDNDEDLYSSASNFKDKHLQQFYTPEDFAGFLASCLPVSLNEESSSGTVIMDPTAGSGSLLKPFANNPANTCIGIEIDRNNIPEGYPDNVEFYNADFTKLQEYMNELDIRVPVLVMNPPFSLKWGEVESQLYTLQYALEHMFRLGVGYMICGKGFADRIFDSEKHKSIKEKLVARLDIKNLFLKSNAGIECSCLFFAYTHITEDIIRYELDYKELKKELNKDGLESVIMTQIASEIRSVYMDTVYVHHDTETNYILSGLIHGCYKQYKKSKSKNPYDINIDSNRVLLNMTNYNWYRLENHFPDKLQSVKQVHLKSLNYLVLNNKARLDILSLAEDGILTISPEAKSKIEEAAIESEALITPFISLPPQQRLGYLNDHSKIKCIKTFTRKNAKGHVTFEEGVKYDLKTSTQVSKVEYKKPVLEQDKNGEGYESILNFSKEVKALSISIKNQCHDECHNDTTEGYELTLSEKPEDITFLINHFEIPNPGDIASKFPQKHKQILARLKSEEFFKYSFKKYQEHDLSRAALKDALILSWEQGLGKTRAALAWSQLRNTKKCLIVCPQDLIEQWIDEAREFGFYLNIIDDFDSVQFARESTQGYFITYFEFLSIVDVVDEKIPIYRVEVFNENKCHDDTASENKSKKSESRRSYFTFNPAVAYQRRKTQHISVERQEVYSKRFKGYSVMLKDTFDTVMVDEGVKIKTKDSLRGIAVRRLKAKNRILLSGSPIKNYFVDLYYLLGWLFSYNTIRFPYEYADREKFLDDFGTFEKRELSSGDKCHHDTERPPKMLPEINQISLFWRLLAPCILRRKKEDTGEPLVAKHIHRIACDFSTVQYAQYNWWNNNSNFKRWFLRTHPGYSEKKMFNLKILGQLWKLRFAATSPNSTRVSTTDTYFNNNPYTNKLLTALKIVNDSLLRDEQVVIFTDLQDNAALLKSVFGNKAMVANGKIAPRKRGLIIRNFKNGAFPILIAGMEALNLGHSLETCSNLIVMDYPWEHSTFRQAIDRIHRLNSKKDVNIYLLFVKGSYDEVMIELVDRKGMSSDLALDGRLINQDELEFSCWQILKEAARKFKTLSPGKYIPETIIQKECEALLRQIHIPRTQKHDILKQLFNSSFSPSEPNVHITHQLYKPKKKRFDPDTMEMFAA